VSLCEKAQAAEHGVHLLLNHFTHMAFRRFKKSDLVAGVIVFGFIAVLFIIAAALGDSFVGQMTVNGVVIQKSDPDYVHKIWVWRIGMFVGFLFCAVLSWISYRISRRISD
jgi:hypothetical protein